MRARLGGGNEGVEGSPQAAHAVVASATPALSSFLPEWLLTRALSEPDALLRPSALTRRAIVVFADISGFTELARRHALEGSAGVERLTRLVSDYLSGLIDLIYAWGGDIEKLYGDAVLAFWLAEPGDELAFARLLSNAARCAEQLVSAFDGHRVSDDLVLRLRVAVVAGDVQIIQVGGVRGRFDLVLAGDCLLEIGGLLDRAASGEVLVSAGASDLLPEAHGRRAHAGEVLHTGHAAEQPPGGSPPITIATDREAELRGYLPGALRYRFGTWNLGWLGEFRRITAMFVSLPDLRSGTPAEHHRLQEAVRTVQATLYRFDGSMLHVAMNDKGPLILAAFGLPQTMHEDDPARAVMVAMELAGALGEQTTARVGIATGPAYCGCVGNDRRRAYTVMGEAVIRAVRLMGAGSRTVVCDLATMIATGSRFDFATLPRFQPKRGERALDVFEPLGQRDSKPSTEIEFVGRADELALLRSQLQVYLSTGRRSVVYVDGEAGMGKSTLIERFRRDVVDLVQVCYGAADPIEGKSPYAIWKPIFARLLGNVGDANALRATVEAALQSAAIDPKLAPLVSAVLPVAWPDNDLTSQMRGETRAQSTDDVLTVVLQHHLDQTGSVVILEDVHWMDSASWGLAQRLVREAAGPLILIASRPHDARSLPALGGILDRPDVIHLRLEAIDGDAVAAVLAASLDVDRIEPRIAEAIVERAAGNPFFAKELALALHESGAIVVRDRACELAPQVGELRELVQPESLQQAILARIDLLPPHLQLTLKVASVIGRTFTHRELLQIYPVSERPASLDDDLETLARYDLARIEVREPELRCSFNHAVTHEAIYNLLTFAQRHMLHEAMAHWLEDEKRTSPPPGLLAHHWSKAGRPERALGHWEAAGIESLLTGSYPEAIGAFEGALAALGAADVADAARLGGRLQRQLGEARLSSGQLEEARLCFDRSLTELGRAWPQSKGGFLRQFGRQAWDQFVQATPLRRLARSRRDEVRDREMAELYEHMGHIAGHTNDLGAYALATIGTLNFSDRLSDRAQFSRSAAFFSLMLMTANLRPLAEHYLGKSQRLLPPRSQARDRAQTLEYQALYMIAAGRLGMARQVLEEAMTLAREIRAQRRLRDLTSLLAIVSMAMGQIEESEALRAQFSEAAAADGDPQLRCWAGLEQAEIALLKDDALAAADHVAGTMPLLGRVGLTESVWAHGLRAATEFRLDRHEAAAAAITACLEAMESAPFIAFYASHGVFGMFETLLACEQSVSAGRSLPSARRVLARVKRFARPYPVCAGRALVLEGRYHLEAGHRRKARAILRRALSSADAAGMPYESALAHEQLAIVDGPADAAHLEAALRIFHRLGARADTARVEGRLGIT